LDFLIPAFLGFLPFFLKLSDLFIKLLDDFSGDNIGWLWLWLLGFLFAFFYLLFHFFDFSLFCYVNLMVFSQHSFILNQLL